MQNDDLINRSNFEFKMINITKKQQIVYAISLSIFCLLLIAIIAKIVAPDVVVAPEIGSLAKNSTNEFRGEKSRTSNSQELEPQSTPFPFQELTIPYLKSREYKSKVGELEKLESLAKYDSFLTSYDSDGLKINGLLTIPTTPMPKDGYPAIVFVHGYIPPTVYKTQSNYYSYVDYFASRGFVVFKIDLRGHDQSEGLATGAYYSGDYVIDVLNAYSALQNMNQVNSERIGLWGHSMAGNVVFRALAAKPEIPKVVIWAGAVYSYEDFSKYRISDNSYRPPTDDSERQKIRAELFGLYGQFDTNSWFWQQVPATNYLDDIKGEVQIHHAVNDNVVDIGYSRDLVEKLGATSIPHELFEYSSGGHNITGAAFAQAMSRSVEFFNDKGE